MSNETEGFTGWAIVELLGHKRLAGLVSEQQIAGGMLLRIDVPETLAGPEEVDTAKRYERDVPAPSLAYTKLVGLGSIYAITPVEESIARAVAREIERYNDPLPVRIQRALPAGVVVDADVEDDDGDLPY